MSDFTDRSHKVVLDEDSIKVIQQNLIDLGFDLGSSGADGDLGTKSTTALAHWQRVNGFSGDVTQRQLDVLSLQSDHPDIYNRLRVQPVVDTLREVTSHLSPERAAAIHQAASHLGVKEYPDTPNRGQSVDDYFSANPGNEPGNSWCLTYLCHSISQVANTNEGPLCGTGGGVKRFSDNLDAHHPDVKENLNHYTLAPADLLLETNPQGKGHAMMVVGSKEIDAPTNYNGFPLETNQNGKFYEVDIIEGNSEDSVQIDKKHIFVNTETGAAYPVYYIDEEAGTISSKPTSPNETPIIGYENSIDTVNFAKLPEHGNITNNFNQSGGYIPPTPAKDPMFVPDPAQILTLKNALSQSTPPMPTLPVFEMAQGLSLTQP